MAAREKHTSGSCWIPFASAASLPGMTTRPAIHWQILTALALATGVAFVLRSFPPGGDPASAGWVQVTLAVCSFTGDLFMRALKMIIVPLIVTSVVSGIANLQGTKGFGRMGLRTALLFVTTTLCATLLGLAFVNMIRPGYADGAPNADIRAAFAATAASAGADLHDKVTVAGARQGRDFFDVFCAMIPENVVAAAADNGQMLGVITFSLLFAIALTKQPEAKLATTREVFQTAHDAMMVLTGWIMALAPIGVFALIVPVVHATGAKLFTQLGTYFFTVIAALSLHLLVVLPLLVRVVGRSDPWAHLRAMRPALLLAFSTASSSGTLPVTMRCLQEGAGVSPRTASFVLPLGATVNMDGTALYECVAVMFVAQVMGIQMTIGEQFFVVVASLLTSIGVAGIPSASLVAILLILKSSGIPGAETAVVALLAVDRPLDMLRTAVNVFGDSCVAVSVARAQGETLRI
jgi:proton glutamate symport protein